MQCSQVCHCTRHDNTSLCKFCLSSCKVQTRVTFSPQNRCYFVKILKTGCQQGPRSCSVMELQYVWLPRRNNLSTTCPDLWLLTCSRKKICLCHVQMVKDARAKVHGVDSPHHAEDMIWSEDVNDMPIMWRRASCIIPPAHPSRSIIIFKSRDNPITCHRFIPS